MTKHRAPRNKNYLLILGCTLTLATLFAMLLISLTNKTKVKDPLTMSHPHMLVPVVGPVLPVVQDNLPIRKTAAEALADEKAAEASHAAAVRKADAAEAAARIEARKKAQQLAALAEVVRKAAAAAAAVIPPPPPVPVVPVPVSGGVAAYQAYAAGKVSASEYACLVPMWNRESSWNPNAQNPTSTAYGIAQFLDSTWASTGYTKTSNPYTQIDAGIVYVNKAYGGACNAWAFWQAHNYY